jgi:hypothetical protein
MNRFILIVLLFVVTIARSQTQRTISVIDFVKIKSGKQLEAMFFYENNWKMYREIALEKGYINTYQLLATVPDTTRGFDLMLITEYADSVQLKLSEARFQQIIKSTRPNGPVLLNNVKPNDFRLNVFLKRAQKIFGSK